LSYQGKGYNGIVDFGYKKHFRVHHGKNEFARGNAHINDIESFWGYAKIRLVKFKGMNKKMFNSSLTNQTLCVYEHFKLQETFA
jgi:hypothetical protein